MNSEGANIDMNVEGDRYDSSAKTMRVSSAARAGALGRNYASVGTDVVLYLNEVGRATRRDAPQVTLNL